MTGCLRPSADGVLIALRVTPRAKAEGIEGLHEAADGSTFLKVKVRAAPEKGKANEAVIEMLATALRLRPSSLSVVSGAADRTKTLRATGNPGVLLAEIDACLKEIITRGP